MLKDPDIYALVELLGQASGLDSPLAAKKQFLLDGLCTLIGAEAWSWSRQTRSGGPGGEIEGASGGSRALLARASRARAGKRTITFCEASDDAASTILFLRRPSSPPFTEREKWLARIVYEEIPWLHEPPQALTASRAQPRLSPRQRETLGHLMAGLSYEEVSRRMGISRNTVHGYVKDLYRQFGQHSRAGLITRLTDTNRTV
jgi:DNA-binding CsgD family transcriptional regulator